ncbi:MAG: cyclase family protein [Spirochaetaceae bacterium]|jgi:kynurenine formamidase|nr:cyclase family protein [Spirochaetaceae bacterium]
MKKMLLVALLIINSVLAFTSARRDSTYTLWNTLERWKSDYQWVDLSFELSPDTPHWYGFNPLEIKPLYTFENTGGVFLAYQYTLSGQYGTHTDFPGHFDPDGRLTHEYTVQDLVYPLVVIDRSAAVALNADYVLTKQDVLDWEAQYGQIPSGSFVAFRSDWSKRTALEYENKDDNGNSHYPGWDIEALNYLIEVRNVAVIGHETPDTDSALTGATVGFIGEDYVLDHDRLNVELLKNLDRVPPVGAIVFVTFPKLKNGTGFTSRVFAISPHIQEE